MNFNEENLLSEIGLSQNESKVYLALLELGSAGVSDIALKANVHRVNIYDALSRLREKGLVASVLKQEKQYFEPASPHEIKRLVDSRKNKLEKVEKEIPRLMDVYDQEKSKQVVHHYMGKKGVMSAFNNLIENTPENGDIYSIGSTGIMREHLPLYTKQFVRKIQEKNITAYILYYQVARKKKNFKPTIVRYIPKGMDFIPMTIYLHNNIVTIISLEPMLAIEIQSKPIFDNYMKYAKWLWDISEE